MANKKLKVGASELQLPAKKSKDDKKKWPGKKAKKKEQQVVETPEAAVKATSEAVPEAQRQDELSLEASPAAALVSEPSTETTLTEPQPNEQPSDTPTEEQTPAEPPLPSDATPAKKSKKLKVKADLKPKQLSMMAAALQVLQQRKVPMTCPDIIDVMATEGLWLTPGGKTPAATLYAAISRSIKDLGKASPFKKVGRGCLRRSRHTKAHGGTTFRSVPPVSLRNNSTRNMTLELPQYGTRD